MQRIYNLLESFLGASKQGYFDKNNLQTQWNCPYCAEEKGGIDNKYNLEISFALGKFHCWSCNNAGNLSKLIRRFGGKDALNEYKAILQDIKESKYYDISNFEKEKVDASSLELQLPKTYTKIEFDNCPSKVKAYIDKRKIGKEIIEKFNIGYTTWDEENWQYRNRIIIPSYNEYGDLNFWVGRDYTGNEKKLKYINPKNIDKNKIVFQDSLIQYDADITLVEGAIDCLYGNNCISLLGKTLTRDCEIYKILKQKSNARIFICLDSDTDISETKRIYSLLNNGRLKNKIWYIRLGTEDLPYKDFGDTYECEGKNGIIKAMKEAKQFSEIELLI